MIAFDVGVEVSMTRLLIAVLHLGVFVHGEGSRNVLRY